MSCAGRAVLVFQGEPAIELKLRLADGCLDAGNAVVGQRQCRPPR